MYINIRREGAKKTGSFQSCPVTGGEVMTNRNTEGFL